MNRSFSESLATSVDVSSAIPLRPMTRGRDSRQMTKNHLSRVLVVDDEALLRWSLAQIARG